jgi:capsular polysaccharide transport system permease protein
MGEQIAVVEVPTKRDVALQRNQKLSRALTDAARKARLSVRGASGWQSGFSRRGRNARYFALLSAIPLLVLPLLTGTIYFGLMASDQFQVEARFAVKGGESLPIDAVGVLTGFPSMTQAQDALIVTDYVQSRAIVEKLDREIDLRNLFARGDVDFFSRFDPSQPIEELVRYWRWRTTVTIEPQSGILTIKTRAFRPEDSLAISNAIVRASEGLVNDLSDRSRRDAVSKSLEDVKRAEQRLVGVREEFRQLRDSQGILDATKSADAATKMLGELKLERIKLENEMRVTTRSMAPNTPQMQVLKARLDAMTGQIDRIEQSMTGEERASARVLSQSYAVFDKLRLDQQWAEKQYQTAATAFERARIDAERQHVYLENIVQPTLPQQAEYPRRPGTFC